MWEREEVDGGRKWVEAGRKGRKERNTRQSGPFMFVPLFGSCLCKNCRNLSRRINIFIYTTSIYPKAIKTCVSTT